MNLIELSKLVQLEPFQDVESLDELLIERQGGMTNIIFKVSKNNFSVIYRIFSDYFDLFLDRSQENQLLLFLQNHGGPKIYYYDSKIRIEQFFDLQPLGDSQVFYKVAQKIAYFHSLFPQQCQAQFDKIIQNKNLNEQILQKIKSQKHINSTNAAQIVSQIFNYQDKLKNINCILNQISKNSIQFCHNDVNISNLLLDENENQIKLLDYEYANPNYRGFEIANFFFENATVYYPKFQIDMKQYPDEQKLKQFAIIYLFCIRCFKQNKVQEKEIDLILNNLNYEQIKDLYQNYFNEEPEVNQLLKEIELGGVYAHYQWGIIGAMSLDFINDLDMLEYAQTRLDYMQNYFQSFETNY